ncbi:hypothetical protein SORDD16_01118 [Streptococcus oralis]|uniref:Uncharacterized protein n=1 Tax=Streptococcus oralis TaxID=1303 RepID=A0A139PDC0_STROR|nr:hypothetical protein SORDD16_01118 [Streptococcus oralis]
MQKLAIIGTYYRQFETKYGKVNLMIPVNSRQLYYLPMLDEMIILKRNGY